MPLVKVWIHFVWTTKNRETVLTEDIRALVFDHIRSNARAKGIYIAEIGGWVEHVHCLVSLGVEQTISEVARLLKGESSQWINQNAVVRGKFKWQHEYFAVSVSESMVERTRSYISGQEEHHRAKSFDDEFGTMVTRFGFARYNDFNN